MSKYIILANWTEQGIRTLKDSPGRVEAARAVAKSLGCSMGEFHMTAGSVDMVFILDAPDDAAAAKFTLTVASKGNVRTTTLKAFSEAEYRAITTSI